mmetsp:Transcript_112784/g.318863  ORF Transcript_112784/g.318863 Transcript_112784/m.318863 type:complete len:207 (+) Transcript_112784:1568-2188(+)
MSWGRRATRCQWRRWRLVVSSQARLAHHVFHKGAPGRTSAAATAFRVAGRERRSPRGLEPFHLVEQEGARQRSHEKAGVQVHEGCFEARLVHAGHNVVSKEREPAWPGLDKVPARRLPGRLEAFQALDQVGVVCEVRVQLVETSRIPLQDPPEALQALEQGPRNAQQHRRHAVALVGTRAAPASLRAHRFGHDPLRFQDAGVVHLA